MVQKSFSTHWKESKNPRKQRKYRHNAPLHVKQKLMHVHLAPILREKYHHRNIQVKKGDKIIILRGSSRGKEGKVERVDLHRGKVFVSGIENIKKEGSRVLIPLEPSNLMIKELQLNDKKRKQKLENSKKIHPEKGTL